MNDTQSISNKLDQPDVQSVIAIAEELAKKNKVIQIDLLYKIAKRRLKFESETLFSIIDLLITKKVIVEGSRLIKGNVLINRYRSDIYQFIKTYPGVHFSVIKREVLADGSSGQFIWHLEVLMKFNFIKEVKVMKYTLFLPSEMEEDFGVYFFLLRDKINLKIAKYLENDEPIEAIQLPTKILESKGSVYYHLKIMTEYKILESKKNEMTGNEEVWLNPEKRELFIKIVNDVVHNNF